MPASLPTTDRRVLRDVAVGGALGALTRTGVLGLAMVVTASELAGVVVVNLVGAVLLARLLSVAGRDPRWLARTPLLATGLLGSFTTYSGLVVPLALLVEDGVGAGAAGWGLGTLLLGVWVAHLGLRGTDR